jgi:hypothetical protein
MSLKNIHIKNVALHVLTPLGHLQATHLLKETLLCCAPVINSYQMGVYFRLVFFVATSLCFVRWATHLTVCVVCWFCRKKEKDRMKIQCVNNYPFLTCICFSDSGLENWDYGRGDPLRWPRDTLYQLKLALTSPAGCGRSVGIVRLWAKNTEFFFMF